MKKMRNVTLCALLTTMSLFGQNTCLDDLLAIEKQLDFTAEREAVFYASYNVRTTDWEDESSQSDVEMYRKGSLLHFFSEQANVFVDEREVIVVMPQQKVVVLNSPDPRSKTQQVSPDFKEWRREFLDSCEVSSCRMRNGQDRELLLTSSRKNLALGLMIESILYDYNAVNKRLNKVVVNYSQDYKLKQMAVTYKKIDVNNKYRFPAVRNTVLDKKDRLTSRYTGYDLIDNREHNQARSKW